MKKILPIFVAIMLCGFTIKAQINLQDGLVAYYPFNGNANDESGNGNNGIVHGSTLTSDRSGIGNSAYSFDGINDYIEVPNSASLCPQNYTLSAWFKFNTNNQNDKFILSKSQGNDVGNSFCIFYQYNELWIICDGSPPLAYPISFINGNWYHVVFLFDTISKTTKIYLNGLMVTNNIVSQNSIYDSNPLLIGAESDFSTLLDFFEGAIDDIRIYNRTINDQEIQALYKDKENPVNPQNGLVAYYPFNGNANDESGNGNNGIVNGAMLTNDRFGNSNRAYSFDGIDDYISTGTLNTVFSEITVQFWFNTNIELNNSIHRNIIALDWGIMQIYYNHGNLCLELYNENHEVTSYLYTIDIPASNWIHLALTAKLNGDVFLYINGIPHNLGTAPASFDQSNDGLGIAANYFKDDPFNGKIDDIYIYNRALNNQEIQTVYNEYPVYPQNGLVAYYPFNGNANDESGNGNNGIINGATLTSDRFGNPNKSYYFNGTTDYISINNHFFNTGWNEYSISGWFNSQDLSKVRQCTFNTLPHSGLALSFNYFSNNKMSFFISSDPGKPANRWDITVMSSGQKSDYVVNTWYHYVFIKNGDNYKLFINGVLDADFIGSISPKSYLCGVIFGSIDPTYGMNEVFKGNLDDIRIYNRALNEQEIKSLYNNNEITTGKITYQVWNNIGKGLTVSSLTSNTNYPSNPTSSKLITSMEGTTDLGDSYGARIVGYICAPATGSYTFWIASDDYGELWLSTNDDPANKHKIAYVNGFTWIRDWNKYATQKSATINLVQGQKYYIEALMKEGTGKDNLAVGWLKPGESGSVPSEIIPGSVLSPFGTIHVNSVTLPPTLALNTGASLLLQATVLPANATVKTLNWTTSDPAVALVNSNGIVTGISTGNATISASSTDGSYISGTCLVTVAGVPTICSATGNINYQVWNNIGSGLTVSSLTSNLNYPDNPTSSTLITSMEATNDHGDNYGARITGYICAPATGSYTFWIASDDYGELWLSTNDDPANKYKIAYVNGYTWIKEWNKYPSQKSVTINLFKGQKYYIEALMKEATGKDNLAVGWLKPGETGSVPSEVIPGSVLSPFGTIPVNSVTLPPTLDLNTGASVLLQATVLPVNATEKIINWTTNDPTIALVNSNGIVTGISTGNATISATSTDGSNKKATCVVTVAGVPTICSATGNITYQVWNNIGSSPLVSSLTGNANYPDNPTSGILINSMEGTKNLADNYGARIVGYLCAPATGSYTFWIASDDYGELWLSTNDDPINKHRIAYVNGYTWIRDWNKYPSQKSVIINLVKGQKYYIEALMKEATGQDNLVVGWLKPGESGPVPSEVIPGSVLSPLIINGKTAEANEQSIVKSKLDVTLLVYPNPFTNEVLNIKLENLDSEATLRIYTISGVKCYEELIQGSEIIKVDRSVFKSGMFLIKVENEYFVKTTKLIVN